MRRRPATGKQPAASAYRIPGRDYFQVWRTNDKPNAGLLPVGNTSPGLFQKRPIMRSLRLQSDTAPDRITSCT